MKTLYALSVTLFSLMFVSQSSRAGSPGDENLLSSFSYPIFAISGSQQYTGTAFFYKSGDTSFLVSNYHAIKGMSPLKKNISFIVDTLYLKYTSRSTGEEKIFPVNISSEITGETEIFSMVDRIDLLKVPVDLPGDAAIRYINELIDPEYFNREPEEVIMFGFPTGPGTIPPFYSKQQKLAGIVNRDGFADYDASIKLNFPDASDSARVVLSNTARYYYFIKPYAAQGYSGAPVFGKFRDEWGKVIYRFTGVIFAGQPLTRQTWAIRGDIALQYLQGKL